MGVLYVFSLFTPVSALEGDYYRAPNGKLGTDFTLYEPEDKWNTTRNHVVVRGVNHLKKYVFVNGQKVSVRRDGGFYTKLKLPRVGKHTIVVSFLKPDGTPVNMVRRVIRRYPIPLHRLNKFFEPEYVYLYNTTFSPGELPYSVRNKHLTRGQLAYFVAVLHNQNFMYEQVDNVFSDVPTNHYAYKAASYAVKNNLMNSASGDTFNPEAPVKRAEYVMAVVQARRLGLGGKTRSIPYKDVPLNSDLRPFAVAAYYDGILPNVDRLQPDIRMSQYAFVLSALRIPEVKREYDLGDKWDVGFALSRQRDKELIQGIRDVLKSEADVAYGKRALKILEPTFNAIVYDDAVTFSGKLYPEGRLRINKMDIPIVPKPSVSFNTSATFKQVFPLRRGRNRFRISLHDFKRIYDVYRLDGFSDMVEHPFRDGSAIMKYYGLAPLDSEFKPDEVVTKAEFVRVAYDVLDPPTKWFGRLGYDDVNWKNSLYRRIRTLVHLGAISPRNETTFGLEDSISRIDAIVGLVALLKDVRLPEQGSDVVLALPYFDLGRHFSKAPSIVVAMNERMISPSESLNPNAPLTRVMLYEMLYNTVQVREIIAAKMDR